ncbi:hypothetical protein ACFLQZ_03915 [Acidobacteriota bacterium]
MIQTKQFYFFFIGIFIITISLFSNQEQHLGGRVVFISDRDGVENLWILDINEEKVNKLSEFPGELEIRGLEQPQWSQSGKKILFAGWKNSNWQIFVINDDGQDLTQITNYNGSAVYCRWDPINKDYIYCTESFGPYNFVFHKINIITMNDTIIIPSTNDSTGNEGFDITSDGLEILFSRDYYHQYSYIGYQDMLGNTTRMICPELNNRTPLGRINRQDDWIITWQGTNFPAYAPLNLFKMDSEGNLKIPITFGVGNEMNFMPCWTHGGNENYILFTSNVFGNWEIVMMKADQLSYPNGITNLTENPAKDREPDWTSTGSEILIDMDIKPGSYPNTINIKSKGVIPVAILSTVSFEASNIDASTVRFGPSNAQPVHYALEDVDWDGDLDMIFHFRTQDVGIECGDSSLSLTGEIVDNIDIKGTDSVRTVGCKK